ncbi:DUF1572 family protein [Cohnella panacarvi]|uniref:DUF1572 family protein n=1 Tax=Cohnella panacarvi TaxID=400776 RepID=UPI00047A7EFC|nr:DUF1572 family protein [Cohnella panacarvi]
MPNQDDLAVQYLDTSLSTFRSQKKLADRAMEQLDDAGLFWVPDPESNSIAIIAKHVAGNMISRWTDFLTTDGEKPNRNRDDEFVDGFTDKQQVLDLWEQGWNVLLATLSELTPDDLLRTVTIREEPHTVVQAIQRQISHYGYHVGQIVYAAKAYRSAQWNTLSIAKNASARFNASMKRS